MNEDIDKARYRGERDLFARLIDEHNRMCQRICGVGDQEAVRCQYRPYFENNGRRCSDCPVYWKIVRPIRFDELTASEESHT